MLGKNRKDGTSCSTNPSNTFREGCPGWCAFFAPLLNHKPDNQWISQRWESAKDDGGPVALWTVVCFNMSNFPFQNVFFDFLTPLVIHHSYGKWPLCRWFTYEERRCSVALDSWRQTKRGHVSISMVFETYQQRSASSWHAHRTATR
jgi:hypothetical protein